MIIRVWKQMEMNLFIENKKSTAGIFLMLIFLMLCFIASAQPNKRLQRIFEQANQALAHDEYELAIDLGQQLLSLDSLYVRAHLLLADVYHETGNVHAEILHLEKASANSEMPLVHLRLGDALYSIGEYNSAMISFQVYLKSAQVSQKFREELEDRKSTRLNSSHVKISYA